MQWHQVTKKSEGFSDLHVAQRGEHWAVMDDQEPISLHASLYDACEEVETLQKSARRHAHVSLDDRVLHCARCGSGDVVGRSDGSVECQMCRSVFTVLIQPLYPSTPGQEYAGMEIGGSPMQPDAPPSFVPPPDQMQPTVPAGTESPFPSKAVPPKDASEEKDEFPSKKATFTTERGHVLSEQDFVRHLAFTHRRG